MKAANVVPDEGVFNFLMDSAVRARNADQVRRIMARMEEYKIPPSEYALLLLSFSFPIFSPPLFLLFSPLFCLFCCALIISPVCCGSFVILFLFLLFIILLSLSLLLMCWLKIGLHGIFTWEDWELQVWLKRSSKSGRPNSPMERRV